MRADEEVRHKITEALSNPYTETVLKFVLANRPPLSGHFTSLERIVRAKGCTQICFATWELDKAVGQLREYVTHRGDVHSIVELDVIDKFAAMLRSLIPVTCMNDETCMECYLVAKYKSTGRYVRLLGKPKYKFIDGTMQFRKHQWCSRHVPAHLPGDVMRILKNKVRKSAP